MTLKSYLWVMSALTAFCWGIFIFVINLVDPAATNWLGFVLFYASLAASLIGTISLLGFIIRFYTSSGEPMFNLVKAAFRQSFLLAVFIVLILILKSQNLFNWLNLILLVILFTIIEMFLTFKKK
jgi:hypothetical protein